MREASQGPGSEAPASARRPLLWRAVRGAKPLSFSEFEIRTRQRFLTGEPGYGRFHLSLYGGGPAGGHEYNDLCRGQSAQNHHLVQGAASYDTAGFPGCVYTRQKRVLVRFGSSDIRTVDPDLGGLASAQGHSLHHFRTLLHVRNPMYIGRFFLMLGFVVMIWQPFITAAFVVLYAIYAHMRVNREEDRLKEIFSPNYQHFCSEVRRWLPRLKPYSKSESRRASWAAVQENHEDIHFVALLVFLAAVYLRIVFVRGYWPM